MHHVYHIALGSNLGDRFANLHDGLQAIAALPETQLVAVAPLYETDPVDCPPESQAFYNSVVAIESRLEPQNLLQHLRSIEVGLGRPQQHDHHAPRTLDLDILCAGELEMQTTSLTLPHPRLHQRRFVLQPLADLAPQLVLPGQKKNIQQLLQGLNSEEAPLRLVSYPWFTI